MQIYYLTKPNEPVIHLLDNHTGGSTAVTVRGSDYYAARHKALQHAIDNGVATVLVMCAPCVVLARDKDQRHALRALSQNEEHGLTQYLCRLLGRFAHVYVPPVSAMAGIPLAGVDCSPTIPMVAAYRLDALLQVDTSAPFGQNLCGLGYDSFTVGDYFYRDLAGKPQLDEYGSTSTWRKAYGEAIGGLVDQRYTVTGHDRLEGRLAFIRQDNVRSGRR